jgi:hypothetical protein
MTKPDLHVTRLYTTRRRSKKVQRHAVRIFPSLSAFGRKPASVAHTDACWHVRLVAADRHTDARAVAVAEDGDESSGKRGQARGVAEAAGRKRRSRLSAAEYHAEARSPQRSKREIQGVLFLVRAQHPPAC